MAQQVTNPLKAIDTLYNGYLFRSRLEARWAVFMDSLGVKYLYEKDGYDLDGVYYLPDFWLPQQAVFLEIKPYDPSDEEYDKASRLAEASGFNVMILRGQILVPDWYTSKLWYGEESWAHCIMPEGSDEHYVWCECPHCNRVELQFDGRADRIPCNCPKSKHGNKGYNFNSPRLQKAYLLARSYRFESYL